MKTVRFLERRTVDYLDGEGEQVYEAGSVHTFRDDKAQRWVTRNAAVYVTDEPEAPKEEGNPRAELDEALATLPGDQTDADYVVNGMRDYFGPLFTEADEAKVRELVKAPEKGPADDNTVGSAADVQGQDGGNHGQRPVDETAGSRKPAAKRASKARHQ